jgi:hypothetical protein
LEPLQKHCSKIRCSLSNIEESRFNGLRCLLTNSPQSHRPFLSMHRSRVAASRSPPRVQSSRGSARFPSFSSTGIVNSKFLWVRLTGRSGSMKPYWSCYGTSAGMRTRCPRALVTPFKDSSMELEPRQTTN